MGQCEWPNAWACESEQSDGKVMVNLLFWLYWGHMWRVWEMKLEKSGTQPWRTLCATKELKFCFYDGGEVLSGFNREVP